MDLFTSFDGRISRKRFWFGLLGMMAVSLVAGLGVIVIRPGGIVLMLAQIIVSAGLIYIWAAVLVKRLHDRGKPALPWVVIFVAPSVLMQIMGTFKTGYSAVELGDTLIMVPGFGALAVMWVSMAAALWMIIELGFLKGTPGDNAYGPNPLGEVQAAQAV